MLSVDRRGWEWSRGRSAGRWIVLLAAWCVCFAGCRRTEPTPGALPADRERPAATEPASSVRPVPGGEIHTERPPSPAPEPPAGAMEDEPAPGLQTATQGDSAIAAFTPLVDAAVHEWAEYAALDGRAVRYEVIETAAATVRTRVQVFDGGRPLGEPAVGEDERDLDPLARRAQRVSAERAARPERIEAAGRAWDARRYEDRWTEEEVHYVRRTWVSEEVPVFGTVRMELLGDGRLEARLELTGFGPGR